ncbi:MAG: hypothetical protein GY847_38885 [Proteobacteria bacterium]|nr:hypothetical protein [Pseudomonadota bacterium]
MKNQWVKNHLSQKPNEVYNHLTMICSLCKQDAGSGATHPVAGLSVCEACYTNSYLPTRLTGRGLHIGFWYRDEKGSVLSGMEDLEDGGHHTLTALAETQYPSEIHAKLQYEGFSAKMHKIFQHELQIGNQAFDDLVWIRTNTEPETKAFLSLTGVQTAIMELIDMKSEIDIDGAKIYLKADSKGNIEVRMFLLYSAALIHYLSEFAEPAR